MDRYAFVVNDAAANQRVGDALRHYFPEVRVEKTGSPLRDRTFVASARG